MYMHAYVCMCYVLYKWYVPSIVSTFIDLMCLVVTETICPVLLSLHFVG